MIARDVQRGESYEERNQEIGEDVLAISGQEIEVRTGQEEQEEVEPQEIAPSPNRAASATGRQAIPAEPLSRRWWSLRVP
jgi:hypothetical protein